MRVLSFGSEGTGGVKGGRTVVVAVVGVFDFGRFGGGLPKKSAECCDGWTGSIFAGECAGREERGAEAEGCEVPRCKL